METLFQDTRYALRMMLKRPSFPLLAVVALALGIGATTAIFSVINSVLFKPLPYQEYDRLVQVWEKRPALGRTRNVVSAPDFFDWKAQNNVFEDMAAYLRTDATLGGGDTPERVKATAVSPNLFRFCESSPALVACSNRRRSGWQTSRGAHQRRAVEAAIRLGSQHRGQTNRPQWEYLDNRRSYAGGPCVPESRGGVMGPADFL